MNKYYVIWIEKPVEQNKSAPVEKYGKTSLHSGILIENHLQWVNCDLPEAQLH